MIHYLFPKPIPVNELEAELRAFVRDVSKEEFDTVSGMVIVVHPTRSGEPFELIHHGSDEPIKRVIFEYRLAENRLKKASAKRPRPDR